MPAHDPYVMVTNSRSCGAETEDGSVLENRRALPERDSNLVVRKPDQLRGNFKILHKEPHMMQTPYETHMQRP